MQNVPSSAILAIISIVAAVLVGTFAVSTFYSAQDSGMKLSGDATQQIVSISSDLNVENGEKLSGSQVKSCIQTNDAAEISLQVDNGTGKKSYYYTLDSDNELGEKIDNTDAKRAMQDKNKAEYYIAPSDVYEAQLIFGEKTGAVTGVLFEKQNAAKRNLTDRQQTGVHEDISVRTVTITLNPDGGKFENPGDDWSVGENGTISRTFLSSDTGEFTLPVPVKKYRSAEGGADTEDVFLGWYNDKQAPSKNVVVDMSDAAFGTVGNQDIVYTARWESGEQGIASYEIQYFFMGNDGSYQNTPNLTLEAGNTTNGYVVRTSGAMKDPSSQNFQDSDSEEAKAYRRKYALYKNGDYIFDSENGKNVLQGTVTESGLKLKVYYKRCYSIQILPGESGSFDAKVWRGYGTIKYMNEEGDLLDPNTLSEEEKQKYKCVSYVDTDTSVKVPYGEDPESYIRNAVGNVSFTTAIPTWKEIESAVKALPDFPDITEDADGIVPVTSSITEYAAALPTLTARAE